MNGIYSIGDSVLNGWVLKEKLGEGNFGRVFKAEKSDFNTYSSAIKIISIPRTDSEIKSARVKYRDKAGDFFRRRAQQLSEEILVMNSLRNEKNIVGCDDHEIIPHEDGLGWDIIIRMELLTPLLDKVTAGKISPEDVKKLGMDICRALEVCEKKKILHRDIKPENIFIGSEGDYKLGDFGISRTLIGFSGNLTSGIGTAGFMAPEVYNRSQTYDGRVDIYSLGMVMYFLLNRGRLPLIDSSEEYYSTEDEDIAIAKRMKGLPLPEPADGSPDLKKAVLKACEFLENDRFQSAAEMRAALENCSDEEAQSAGNSFTSEVSPAEKETEEHIISSKRKTIGKADFFEDELQTDSDFDREFDDPQLESGQSSVNGLKSKVFFGKNKKKLSNDEDNKPDTDKDSQRFILVCPECGSVFSDFPCNSDTAKCPDCKASLKSSHVDRDEWLKLSEAEKREHIDSLRNHRKSDVQSESSSPASHIGAEVSKGVMGKNWIAIILVAAGIALIIAAFIIALCIFYSGGISYWQDGEWHNTAWSIEYYYHFWRFFFIQYFSFFYSYGYGYMLLAGILSAVLGVFLKYETEKCELNFSDTVVSGRLPHGREISMPTNRLTGLRKCLFQGISVASLDTVVCFYCMKNRDEVYNALNSILGKAEIVEDSDKHMPEKNLTLPIIGSLLTVLVVGCLTLAVISICMGFF